MPTVDIYNIDRTVIGQLELSDNVFAVPVKPHLMHEVVLYQLAKRRAGTAQTKGRSDVAGGGKKPWRQKGNKRITLMGLKIVDIRPEENLLIVKGAVPGSSNGIIYIRKNNRVR